jgi:hypothetical protein
MASSGECESRLLGEETVLRHAVVATAAAALALWTSVRPALRRAEGCRSRLQEPLGGVRASAIGGGAAAELGKVEFARQSGLHARTDLIVNDRLLERAASRASLGPLPLLSAPGPRRPEDADFEHPHRHGFTISRFQCPPDPSSGNRRPTARSASPADSDLKVASPRRLDPAVPCDESG